jgi:hypothetical protein
MTVHQINQLGRALEHDMILWGAAAIGLAVIAATAMWIIRLLR